MDTAFNYGIGPLLPEPNMLTWPCAFFGSEYRHLQLFIGFIAASAHLADNAAKRRAFEAFETDNNLQRLDEAMKHGMGIEEAFAGFRPVVLEMVLCRNVDCFLIYTLIARRRGRR